MKLKITDWIENGNISPLKWGDSFSQIEIFFKNSSKDIFSLKQRNYPIIFLDFVEFYFNDDINYTGLNEVIIKPMSIFKGYKSKYFHPDWLTDDLTFEVVSKKLTEMNISWDIEYGPNNNTPNIRTKSGVLLAFDPLRPSDKEALLMKIYMKE